MSQRLAYPDDPFMAAAWASAVSVAAETPGILAAYEEDRRRPFRLLQPKTRMDQLIDEATGADRAAVEDFVEWFNENVWGEDPFASSEP